jgi:LacI family transcriptional regulator
MSPVRRIAVLVNLDAGFCRDVVSGIQAYAIEHAEWIFHREPPALKVLAPLRQWKPHGIIAQLATPEFARSVMRLRKPVVDLAYTLPNLDVPVVDADHTAVGRMAAEHFLDRGFAQFGFFGSGRAPYSREREAGFRDRLAEAGFRVSTCHADYLPRLPLGSSWTKVERQVRQWLRRLPKPVAVLACNDLPAYDLAVVCRCLELRVPDDVALLGVDNDELECRLATPPISSIDIPAQRIGYEAARLLDQLLRGRRPASRSLFLPPIRVVTRQSTDTLATSDPVVRAALSYIRQHATSGVTVDSVVCHIDASRRELERHFRRVLGRSVLTEIRRVRVERAKELLTTTDLAMPAIAGRCGFSTPQRLAIVFRQVTGLPPTAFRRRSQIRDQGEL